MIFLDHVDGLTQNYSNSIAKRTGVIIILRSVIAVVNRTIAQQIGVHCTTTHLILRRCFYVDSLSAACRRITCDNVIVVCHCLPAPGWCLLKYTQA